MEDSKKDLLAGIGAVVDYAMTDPAYQCIYCKAGLEFRIDQFTRQEPDSWTPLLILRDDGWAKVLRSDNSLLGRVCPSCIDQKQLKP